MKTRDITEGVGKITSQNATKDVPVGGEYMNIKKLFPNQKKPMKLGEGYKLNLERDKKADMYILHIQDTKTGNRTEVRGKTGYEGKGYDPEDKLHKLLDTIGRSANVSELINGEVVTINPKHPQAPSASAATDTAFNEASNPRPPKWKRTGPDGEIEIEFPTGRRFKIEKQYDENIRHRGEWKVLEWDTRSEDWEWGDTYSPKGYAKEMVMKMGQYDSNGKQVADYSHTFQFEATSVEENFADGKVKGKSKPGRVKAAGASCDGSVTELRKKAKNSSGEKQKMYHWCANMKAGKKK